MLNQSEPALAAACQGWSTFRYERCRRCADLTGSVKMDASRKSFQSDFFRLALQNLVTVGAGLAAAGKIAFVSSYAAFMPGRCWSKSALLFASMINPVKLIGAHAGISVDQTALRTKC